MEIPGQLCVEINTDTLWSGRRLLTFNVIDEFSREGLRIAQLNQFVHAQ